MILRFINSCLLYLIVAIYSQTLFLFWKEQFWTAKALERFRLVTLSFLSSSGFLLSFISFQLTTRPFLQTGILRVKSKPIG